MKSTKIIGLTGGIGSGKSKISQYLESKGTKLYYADTEAKSLMHNDPEVKKRLIEAFGTDVFKNNKLQTKTLAQLVFNDTTSLEMLNAIVHPAVKKHLRAFVNRSRKKYLVVENAILFEAGFDAQCDYIVCVTAPLELRISRVMKRDQVTKAQVMSRINQQWKETKKVALSNFIIENIDWEKTVPQIDQLIDTLTLKFSS